MMTSFRSLDKVWYLRQINLFAGVGEIEMQRLVERTTMREFSHEVRPVPPSVARLPSGTAD